VAVKELRFGIMVRFEVGSSAKGWAFFVAAEGLSSGGATVEDSLASSAMTRNWDKGSRLAAPPKGR